MLYNNGICSEKRTESNELTIDMNSKYVEERSIKMGVIQELLQSTQIPEMVRIRQIFDDTHIPVEQIPEAVKRQLLKTEIVSKIKPGKEIAITVGSRGVANVGLITKSIADFIKEQGATPFVVPAMGSHGGATGKGQREVIEGYGVTEEIIGCEIRSSMETVCVGYTENKMPVYLDKNAYYADGIIVCGRVKPHTGFRGPYESGIMKMMTIGLGKQKGAETVHTDGFGKFCEYIPMFGKVILQKAPVICGLALLENAYDRTREIVALTPEEIISEEPNLLLKAKTYMPRILFDSCDVLIVDKMGKEISGDGMDPNITGRFPTPFATGGIKAQRLAVLDLTKASHGNACGIGLADVTTRRLFKKMEFEMTYPNAITNTVTDEMKIPMVMENDELAVKLCIKSCNYIDKENPRIVRIHSTMELQEIEISASMVPDAANNPDITILGNPAPMTFDESGNLF